MIDAFWSDVLGESVELEKVFDYQPDKKIVSNDAVLELGEYVATKVDHLEEGRRCSATEQGLFDFLSQYVGDEFVNGDGKYGKRIVSELRTIGFIGMREHTNAMSQIVNRGISLANKIYFRFTTNLTWEDGDYGDGNSCFWGMYSEHLEALNNSEHGAIQFLDDATGNYRRGRPGIGRVWAFKLTYDGINYLGLSNFYAKHNPIRRLDMTLAIAGRFGVECKDYNLESDIYMNEDSCIVAKKITFPIGNNWIEVDVDNIANTSHCYNCDDVVHDDDVYLFDDEVYCECCYTDTIGSCVLCEERYHNHDLTYIDDIVDNSGHVLNGDVCYDCRSDLSECYNCGAMVMNGALMEVEHDYYCMECGGAEQDRIDKLEEEDAE